jgi:hypothetical protein
MTIELIGFYLHGWSNEFKIEVLMLPKTNYFRVTQLYYKIKMQEL